MVDHLQFVSDMTDEQVRALTDLLAMPPKYLLAGGVPAPEWLARQEEKMARLPKELTRPTNLVDRTRIALAKKGLSTDRWIPQVAALCPTHALLNPWIVHRVFLLLQHEVMHKVNPARYHRGELKTQEVLDYCAHVSGILSLFKTRTEFAAMSRVPEDRYPADFRFDRIASGCEACVLAVVGARAQLLVDLKASLLARVSSKRHKEPRLMRFVDRWLECFGPQNEGELLLAAGRLGAQLRAINKAEARRRREAHRRKKEKIAAIAAERDDMEHKLRRQRITASQLRMGLGDIDRKIEEKYGKEWERGKFRKSRKHRAEQTGSARSQPTTGEDRQQREEQLYAEPHTPRGLVDGQEVHEQNGFHSVQYACNTEYDPIHYEDDMHFEQDERNPDHEQQLEESFDDWYQRSVSAASRAPPSAEPFDWSGSVYNDHLDDARSFAAKSAVPSPLLIVKGDKGKETEREGSSVIDRQDEDDGSWVSVTVHSNASSERVVGAANDAPPVPRIPSKYGVFEDIAREEQYAPSSVYSSDEKLTFTPSPGSTPVVSPADPSSTARVSGRSAWTPLESPTRSPFRYSKAHRADDDDDDDDASVSTLKLGGRHEDSGDDKPVFSDPWTLRSDPDGSRSVVSSAISPGTQRPGSHEYAAMQAELEDAYSMVEHDDGVSDEIVRPDDSISQVHARVAPPPTRAGTVKSTLRSVQASVRPVRNASKRSDAMSYLGLYRDD